MKTCFRPGDRPLFVYLLLVGLTLSSALLAQADRSLPTEGVWVQQGPSPATSGQVENVSPDNEVVGAVHALLTHPSNADIIYIGAVNGGIWKTENATATSPNWVRQTDGFQSLSIGGLDFDTADSSNQTLLAGVGRFSSYGREGGARIGLLRTTNGGASWTVIDGGGVLAGKNITAVAARGNTLVAAVNTADDFTFSNIGIWRSTNGGASFTQIASGDGSATGLPGGVTLDLGRDRANPTRLFTSVIFADLVGGQNGIYRSNDTGASWTKVSSPQIDALVSNETSNLEFAISGNTVFAAIVNNGRLAGVFRSANGGDSWVAMDLPQTIEDGFLIGIHPGGQGSIHLSLAVDPSNDNIIYIGGDRQPFFSEASGGSSFFPNSIQAFDFSGRLFRGDFSQPPGSQWTPLTHVGTASNSSPHADSREMAFAVNGDLIEVDDGGIYRRVNPSSTAGDWFSMNGDLASTEYHSIDYDTLSKIIIGGAQDVGTTEQIVTDGNVFRSVSTADGGDVAVDNAASASESIRYSSFQNFGAFRWRTVNAGNAVSGQSFPALTPLNGASAIEGQFVTPIAANSQVGNRLLIGGGNGLYETFDRGSTVDVLRAPGENPGEFIFPPVNAFAGSPIIYGVPGNPDYVLIASGTQIFRRMASPPANLAEVSSPVSTIVNDLAVDSSDPDRLFVVSSGELFRSSNGGAGWSSIFGNLSSLNSGRLRSLVYVSGADNALLVGADRGIFVAYESTGFQTWSRLGGSGLPNALVFELDYDVEDDVLIAGLMGRGSWKFVAASDLLFSDRFQEDL